jgi:RNA polymerase sigma-70 factor, ECF subfamily
MDIGGVEESGRDIRAVPQGVSMSAMRAVPSHAVTSEAVWTAADTADRRAIARVRCGEVAAFAEVVTRHQERLMATAYHLLRHPEDAADAVQETFLRAYRALDQYDEERRFAAWLSRITTNVCLSTLRARQARPVACAEEREYGTRDGAYSQVEQALVLRAALGTLDPQDTTLLLLRHVQQLSAPEIGEIMHLPAATVRTRLARARAALRAALPPATDVFDDDTDALVVGLTLVESGGKGER